MCDDKPGFLRIDGAYGEGGGQIVRTALALSALTARPVCLEKIRAGRTNPGLRPQHLAAVRAIAEVCRAEIRGAELGSKSLCFAPTEPPRPGSYRWEIGTAGSVSLVFQSVLWPLAYAGGTSEIVLVGGTHVEWSPPVDYLQQIYLPQLSVLVVPQRDSEIFATVNTQRWGWYPKGGGMVSATVEGHGYLGRLALTERGSLRSVSVFSAASNLPDHIRQRQADRADFLLRKRGIAARIQLLDPPSPGQGTMVFVLAEYQHARAAFTAYGRIRKPAEKVAEEACKAFVRYHKRGQPVDEHLGDQILLPLALASRSAGPDAAPSCYGVESVTRHLLTQAWLIQRFLGEVHIEIEGETGKVGTVVVSRCTG